jgi:transglutaminase-like putative cysteine protease/predicted esterase
LKTTASALLLGFLFTLTPPRAPAQETKSWWPAEVDQALGRAGDNRPELVKALTDAPAEQRNGMAFLIAHMPDRDLKSLRADFLLENVRLAYKVRGEVPWGKKIPEDLFLNDVLPYANVDESRDPWRQQLYELCLPIVKDCRTPGEAAQKLNKTIFNKLNVHYSTNRKQPHQSPKESIAQGKATCTGLAILLSDACRSVGIPARLAGTPLWWNKRGNHTWTEIWDGGWHFAGADEPDPKGLDRGWFVGDAAKADKDSRLQAIYATSFRKTGVTFPLVWARDSTEVNAVNVTDRYTGQKPPPGKALVFKEQLLIAEKAARAYFTASPEERANWKFDAALDDWLAGDEAAVRRAVWQAYRTAPAHAEAKKDFDQNQVRFEKHLSPYTVKKVGKRPAKGWPLFIAMHGGGGAPQQVNDSQWEHMKIYYKDQSSVEGYQYLALRAPNNIWNGFYDDYVPPLIINLIRQFLLFGDVDPDKVFIMGYSHGGYGAFFIGPKIPDRFAAIHASAAAPTDGTISPKNLRTTRFTFMIGEKDNAYGRRERCEKFNKEVEQIKQANPGDYPVEMEFKEGYGHGGLPDRDKIKAMYPYTRNPVPRHVTWELTDAHIKQLFWLTVPHPGKGQDIDAKIAGNTATIATHGVKEFDLSLDGRLVDFAKPLRVVLDGKTREVAIRPSFRTLCESLRERGDPEMAYTCRVRLAEKDS